MKQTLVSRIVIIILLAISLASCQQVAQTTLPLPTQIPPTSTPVVPTDTPAMPNTPEPSPTATPVPPTATITAQAERPVESIDELVGVWQGSWSDLSIVLLEFKASKQSTQQVKGGGQFSGSEWYDFNDGLLIWGKHIKPMNAAQKCIDNPEATYEVYITYRGEQPEKVRFVLVGEDQCYDRQEFLDGKFLSFVGT